MTGRALVVCATLALAGCGGGGDDEKDPGARAFAEAGCSGCHTLKAAGADGRVGPDLDRARPSAATVARQVRRGGGGMPSFAGKLSDEEIEAIAAYVAKAAGR